MAKEFKRIKVAPGTELARLLEEAAEAPLLLEKNGDLYRLSRAETGQEDVWADYDPEAALAGIRAAAGSWKDIDPEVLKAFVYRAREEGTQPADRP